MEKNKKILKYGLISIALFLVINIGFSLFIRLREPVFLKIYSESYIYDANEKGDFEDVDYYLYYITNVNDSRRVSYINFVDEPEITASANEAIVSNDIFNFNHNPNPYNDKIYGRYSLRQVHIRLNLNNLNKDFDSVELNNVTVGFSNGDILSEDLGQWIVYNDKNEGNHFRRRGGGASSSGRGHGSLEVKEDIELIKIDFPMLDEMEDYMEMYIRRNNSSEVPYKDIEGMECKAGDELHIESQFSIPGGELNAYNIYMILPRLYFKDKNGNISSYMIDYMGRYPWYYLKHDHSFIGILKYLKTRGAI